MSMMRFKSFCIMADVLVQTRLPTAVARVVQRRAEAEGDSVAGWIRRLIIKEIGSMRIGAFLAHHRQADPSVVLRQGYVPSFYLQPVRDISATERVFVLLNGPGSEELPGSTVRKETFMGSQAFQRPADHRFLLEGSPNAWTIVTAMYDDAAKRTEVTLKAEPSPSNA